jgi:hypothetical protein
MASDDPEFEKKAVDVIDRRSEKGAPVFMSAL